LKVTANVAPLTMVPLSNVVGSAPVPVPAPEHAVVLGHRVTVWLKSDWFVQVTLVWAGTLTAEGLKQNEPDVQVSWIRIGWPAPDEVPDSNVMTVASTTPMPIHRRKVMASSGLSARGRPADDANPALEELPQAVPSVS
jgi:hypothetical protein